MRVNEGGSDSGSQRSSAELMDGQDNDDDVICLEDKSWQFTSSFFNVFVIFLLTNSILCPRLERSPIFGRALLLVAQLRLPQL
jgi:hypothetical protein